MSTARANESEPRHLRADVAVNPGEVELVVRDDARDRGERDAVVEPEAELGVLGAGLDELVGVRFDTGCDPHVEGRRHPDRRREPGDAIELGGRVDDDPTDACVECAPQLGVGLVVAVENDAIRREPGVQRDEQLAARGDVEAETLLRNEASHRDAQERLARVRGARAERRRVIAAPRPQLGFVVHVERRPEAFGQFDQIDAGERHAAIRINRRRVGQQRHVERRVGGTHRSVSGSVSSSRRAISSGACTPRMPRALARPTRHASVSHNRAWVNAASSVSTRQSR